jgi:hypothetical protein
MAAAEKMNIWQKLALVQQQLKAPKTQYNAFGKYKYRKLEDIEEAVKPLLAEVGATLTFSDRVELVGDRYYLTTEAVFTDIADGQQIICTARAREEDHKAGMDGSQITGSSSSYARKYAANGLFAIDDTADSDTTNTGAENGQNRTQGGKTGKPSAAAYKPAETKGKRLSDEAYWNTVGAHAAGQTTNDGGSIRDWFIQYTAATPEQVSKFDADVDNWRAAHI